MTVNNTNVTAGPYIGNNTSSVFSYEFKILDSDELNVYETDDNGVETLLTLDTDYTVQDVGEAVGTVTRSAGNLPTGYTWFIVSNYDELQETSFSSQGAFFPKIHERAFDKLTKLVQQTAYNVSNAFKNLNMRGFKITNLQDGVDPQDGVTFGQVLGAESTIGQLADSAAASAAASADSAAASESALDTFVDTQWGAYATEPALSPIGNPATAGDQYFNTTTNTMRVYNGSAWQAAASSINGIRNSYNFTNVAGQTVFNAVYDVGFVDVLYNGAEMSPANYTANDGLTVVLNAGVTKADDEINIKAYNYVDFGDASNLPVTATGTTTPRALRDRFTDTTNVEDFSSLVVGNDWTAAIAAAIAASPRSGKLVCSVGGIEISSDIHVVEKGRPDNGVYEIDFTGTTVSGTGNFIFDSCKNLSVKGLQAPTLDIILRGVWYSSFRQCKATRLISADQVGTTFTSCYWNDFHTCVFQTIIRGATEHPVNAYTFYGVSLRGNTGQGFVTTADYNIIMLGTTSSGNAQNWVFYGGDLSYAGIATEDLSGSHLDADVEITYSGVYFDSVIPVPVLKGNTRIATRDCHVANFEALSASRGAIGTAPHELHRSDRSVKSDPASNTNLVVAGDFTTVASEVSGSNAVISSSGGATITNTFGGLKGQVLNIAQSGVGTTFIRTLASQDEGIATCAIAMRSSVSGVPQQIKVGFKHGAASSRFTELTINGEWTYYALTDPEPAAAGTLPSVNFSNVGGTPYDIDFGFISVSMGAGAVMDGALSTPRSIAAKASVDVGSISPLGRFVADIPVIGSVSRDSFVDVSHIWGNMVVSSSLVTAGVVRLIIFNPTGTVYAPGAVNVHVKVTERVNGSM